jgi:L,D-peptidoglycan transpeptidase YkuD (ErfK/YbiS/YcfS/YnhG family)
MILIMRYAQRRQLLTIVAIGRSRKTPKEIRHDMLKRSSQKQFQASNTLRVQTLSARAKIGHVSFGWRSTRCALGRSGARTLKREGDGATPIGTWHILRVLYRHDRIQRPRTVLPVTAMQRHYGWCDDPRDRNYNRAVQLPYPASTEALFRADAVYDIVVILDHNTRPRRRGAGSAIFMHLARRGYTPTEGCIALSLTHMRQLLAQITPGTRICIGPSIGR